MAVNDNMIELIAKLDEDKSVKQIVNTDIPIIRDRINDSKALQIKCTIDKDSINDIKNQLKDIKINVGNISNSSSADVISQSQVKQIKEYNKEVKNATENAIALNKARMSRGNYPKIPYTGNTDKTLEVAKNTVNAFLDGTGDIASRVRIANEDATQSLKSFVVQVEKESGAIETLTYHLNKEARVYEYLGKTIREATNATTFRHEGVDVQKEKRFADLEKIINQLKTAELYSTTFANRINELKTELASVNDTNGMNKFLDKLSVLNSDISATKAESQYMKSKIRDEERIIDLAKQEKEIRESAQHDYWQGQFNERIKAMTAENQVLKDMKKYYEELDRITRNFNSTKTSLNDRISTNISSLNSKTTNTTFRKNANNIDVQNQIVEIQSLISEYQKLSSELQTATTPEALVAIQDELDKLKPKLNTVNDSTKRLITSLNNNSAQTKLANGIKGLSASMDSYAQQNKKVINSNKLMSDGVTTFAQKWQELITRLKSEDLDENGLGKINQEFVVLKKEATAANLTTSAFFRNMRTQLSQVLMQWISLQGAIRITRSLINEVINLDNAMVELRKVTEASDKEFEAFQKSAAVTAKTLGASVSDVVNATSVFSRAGFTLPEAEELGRVATLYKNVGDGITIDSAAESIISIMKAFNLEAKDSERIIDRINKVSNTFAVDSGGLGEALKRVSSAMASANNTLDQTIALTTVANEIVQDPVAVAQAWRTVSMRIRAAKAELEEAGEDTEGMVESTAKLQAMIKNMTGVDIMVDKDTFKSTYDIIKELGAVWDDLKDIEQAQILEAIAGKRQANVVASALRNYEKLDDVLQTSIKSENSAMQEQEEYSKSIQYSLDTLKAAYQEFANTVINNESTKKMLGVAQNFLEILTKIIDKLGTFPTLMAGLGATLSMTKGVGIFGVEKNAKEATRQLTIFGQKWTDVKSNLQNGNTSGISKIGTAIQSLKLQAIGAEIAVTAMNAAVSFGLSLAVSWAVSSISKWINKEKEAAEQAEKLRQEMEERRKQTVANIKAYEDETESINSLIGQYVKLISTTNDISSINDDLSKIQDQIIEKYGLEADAIDLVNGKLEENIRLLLEQEQQRNDDWLRENAEGIEDAEDLFNQEHDAYDLFSFHGEEDSLKKSFGAARIEASKYFEYLKEEFKRAGISDLIQENLGFSRDSFTYGFALKEGLSPEQQVSTINKVIEVYEKLNEEMSERGFREYFNLQGDDYNNLIDKAKQYADSLSIIQTKQQMLSESESLDSLLSIQDLTDKEQEIVKLYKQTNDEIDSLGISTNRTIYGNIDTNSRQTIQWTKENLERYKDELKSLGENTEDLLGSYSTVMGSSREYNGIEVAYSPLLQTENGAVPLSQHTIDEYIYALFDKAGANWKPEDIIALDAKGLEFDGRIIKNIIADIGDTAIKTGEAMHYVGKDGALSEITNQMQEIADKYNVSIQDIVAGEDLKTYEKNIKQLTTLYKTFNDTTQTPTKRFSAFVESEEIKTDIQDLIYLYPALKDQAEATMQSLGTTTSTVIANEETLFNSFVETLDKIHKEAFSNIDKMESAMASAIKGEGLSHDSAWELLKLDTDGLLNPVIDSTGKYRFALEDIVLLKDKMIEKNKELIQQDLKSAQAEMKQAQDELKIVNQMIRNQASGNTRPNEDLVRQQYQLSKSIEAFGDEIERDNLLIKEYDSHLGNLANTEKMLQAQVDALKKSQEQLKNEISDLNSQADRMLKAQEMKIDSIVDGLEAEEQILENDKELLQEQLDILEKQKEELENIIEQYKSVADIVGNTISDQIDEIKKNQQAVEDYYNKLIDKLKSENKERADALDYAEKLAALENAKNNKVRVYGNGTGWTYMVDQDALAKAQRALEEADEDKAIQELEAQRDAEVKAFDVQISAFEEYADEWKDIVDSIQSENDERLAQEILGSDWREKISNKDIKILQSFKTEYRNYNSQLTILTNNEIKNLEASIKAKDKEIDAKKKQIQVWKDYKSEVENTVNTIKNSLENYEDLLNQIVLDENSTYEQRQANLSNFANKYSDIISQINRKNSELDTATSRIENLNNQITELNNNPIKIEADVSEAADEMADFIEKYRDAIEAMRKRLEESITGFGIVNSAGDEKLVQAAQQLKIMGSHSDGGVVNYTGLAQMHGSPNKSETVFNAAQSRELWNMVRSGQFSNLVAEKAIHGINFNLKNLSPNSNTSNRTVNIGQMTIKTDNPKQFHSQFMTEMKQYWDVQLSESPIQ